MNTPDDGARGHPACRQRRRPFLTLLAALGCLTLSHSEPGQATQAAGPARWAMLDFDNASGYGGADLGRAATDAVTLELGQLNRYDIFSRQETQQALNDLGFTPPINANAQRRLARHLGGDAVATGEVTAVVLQDRPPRARVSLAIRVRDAATGELLNGARVIGESGPQTRPTFDAGSLVQQAITDAAFSAAGEMSQYVPPRATVLLTEGTNDVLLNSGSRAGLRPGLGMVVTRQGQRVGKLRVTRVETDESEAVVTDPGAGIAPEDVAEGIYVLPAEGGHL